MVLGFYVTLQAKTDDGANSGSVSLQISGSNLGTIYLAMILADNLRQSEMPVYTTTESGMFDKLNNAYTFRGISGLTPLKILDATTTIKLRITDNASATTCYIKDVTIDVIYVESFTED